MTSFFTNFKSSTSGHFYFSLFILKIYENNKNVQNIEILNSNNFKV